jgi:hypothetical protein
MFTCQRHAAEATKSTLIDYALYSCGGNQRGCYTAAFLASGGGPQDPCPVCGRAFTRTGTTQIAIGYCEKCWPHGVPDQIKPTWIPVTVVGGFIALK